MSIGGPPGISHPTCGRCAGTFSRHRAPLPRPPRTRAMRPSETEVRAHGTAVRGRQPFRWMGRSPVRGGHRTVKQERAPRRAPFDPDRCGVQDSRPPAASAASGAARPRALSGECSRIRSASRPHRFESMPGHQTRKGVPGGHPLITTGAAYRIRTCDVLIRSQTLYPAEVTPQRESYNATGGASASSENLNFPEKVFVHGHLPAEIPSVTSSQSRMAPDRSTTSKGIPSPSSRSRTRRDASTPANCICSAAGSWEASSSA